MILLFLALLLMSAVTMTPGYDIRGLPTAVDSPASRNKVWTCHCEPFRGRMRGKSQALGACTLPQCLSAVQQL